MNDDFPLSIEQSLRDAAGQMGRSLEALEWPSDGKNAPFPEANVVLNIAACLGNAVPPFSIYSEGTVGRGGRIDLMGSNGEVAFALEAKTFGDIRDKSGAASADLDRLKDFRPALAHVVDGHGEQHDWWGRAESRWGVLVIASCIGSDPKDAWCASDDAVAREAMATWSEPKAHAFLALREKVKDAHRDAQLIVDGARWNASEAWLMWAAFPLPRSL